MIDEREHRVAIATGDGQHIARHFRTTPFFLVYTVKEGRLLSIETRVNAHASDPAPGEGRAECWKVVEDLLSDVRVVIVSGMGKNAYVGLLRRDILPLLTQEEFAGRAVDEYLRGHLKECPDMVQGK